MEKETGTDHVCDCDHPDTSLLRVVLIGEIVRADEAVLYTLAEICETLGILQFVDEEEEPSLLPPSPPKKKPSTKLRRVK